MDIWNDYAYPRILQLARHDPEYQQYLTEIRKLEAEFLRISAALPERDREILEDYLVSSDNLEYRFAQLAYECGRSSVKQP